MRTFAIDDWFTTADIGLTATGDTPGELFQAAAEGMFSIILGPSVQAGVVDARRIDLCAVGVEQLLVDWLSELIYLFDAHGLVPVTYRAVEVRERETAVQALVEFRRYDPDSETAAHEIKAVTYYRLRLERIDGGYRCHLVFDI